jgi:hypothetical protein
MTSSGIECGEVGAVSSGHTPGPLMVVPRAFGPTFFIVREDHGSDEPAIAEVYRREDANLFKAAPDLLEALKASRQLPGLWTELNQLYGLPNRGEAIRNYEQQIAEIDSATQAAIRKAESLSPDLGSL